MNYACLLASAPGPKLTKKCTFKPDGYIKTTESTFCFRHYGYHTVVKAKKICKSQNATLPLPKTEIENDSFMVEFNKKLKNNFSDFSDPTSRAWIDMQYDAKTGQFNFLIKQK